ncbi:MAG: UDP-N-acetylmuramoyl-tripeptide--D-alanyl-D-alanine ligase [Betaproteobacteria bacterium]|nr:UDP-N-acetylmuramoyl-tripeptide--D-alanyl-D-alanine ligase [Betaproteobacteria bacterium]
MMSLTEAALAVGGRAQGAAVRFGSVSTDSRAIEAGGLFVALRGERFDGHDFIDRARARGACAAMVDRHWASRSEDLPRVVVDDTKAALGRLAAHWRSGFDIPLIAVVGSNGKTTVKDMIAAALRAHFGADRTPATAGNLNNDIGLPLTLLGLRPAHRAAVVELGMNHRGETAALADIAVPTVALVNNAQREHQEFLHGLDDVAREHGDVLAALPARGIAVINADDGFAGYWRERAAGRPVRDFGIERSAAVSGRYTLREFGAEIEIASPEGSIRFAMALAGVHSVRNAVAAAAAATAAGASLEAVAAGLSSFRGVKGRLQMKPGRNGCMVIDDTYNANPDSVRAAIEVLARLPGRRILVLGDMGEVGEQGEAFHREAGAYAAQAGVDELLASGDLCRFACAAFGANARWHERIEDLCAALLPQTAAGTIVLVKGSRFMRMERVVAVLVQEEKR